MFLAINGTCGKSECSAHIPGTNNCPTQVPSCPHRLPKSCARFLYGSKLSFLGRTVALVGQTRPGVRVG
jgi:hypothetical protein